MNGQAVRVQVDTRGVVLKQVVAHRRIRPQEQLDDVDIAVPAEYRILDRRNIRGVKVIDDNPETLRRRMFRHLIYRHFYQH